MKSDFVSNVSHELRTPLALIRLYAETLELGRITTQEKKQQYYRIIRKESERLTALINNILDFSRIEAGRKEYEFRNTDIAELVRNTLESYRYQIEQQGFAFEENIDPNLPAVPVDREAIARALVNLVNNALKYSSERKVFGCETLPGQRRCKTRSGGPRYRDHAARSVERFLRSSIAREIRWCTTPREAALAFRSFSHITQAHGGEIAVESTPGKGSRFTLSLPLTAAAQQPAVLGHIPVLSGTTRTDREGAHEKKSRSRTNQPGGSNGGRSPDRNAAERGAAKKTRILIVEDEPAMVAGLRDNFEYEGYDVISAADGIEGLDRALADDPDLVVLDVMMPRLSGLDVCKQLKTRKPALPIIMLTARGQEIDKVVGLELGADDYVTKPFSIRELMARVKAVLRRASPHAPAAEVYRFSDVEVNVRSNEVLRAG